MPKKTPLCTVLVRGGDIPKKYEQWISNLIDMIEQDLND
jgi:hypothetical protein